MSYLVSPYPPTLDELYPLIYHRLSALVTLSYDLKQERVHIVTSLLVDVTC